MTMRVGTIRNSKKIKKKNNINLQCVRALWWEEEEEEEEEEQEKEERNAALLSRHRFLHLL